MDFKQEIKKILKKFLKNIPEIEIPPNEEMGDYALPCFTLAKEFKKNPQQIAKEIADKIKPNKAIKKVVAIGPYVNFFINKAALSEETIKRALKEKDKFGVKNKNKKTIVIDFSSPNIAKPFGVGHLRSTVIGNALRNIYKAMGYTCIGINHLGDWGTQFGKLIVAYKKWGDDKKLRTKPIKHLFELYVKFHDHSNEELESEARLWFRELENGNKEAISLWKRFRELSLIEFKKIYEQIGVRFEKYEGESFYNKQLDKTVKLLDDKKLLEEDQGAKVVKLEGLPPALIKKSDGSTLYITRDLAALVYREKEYKPEQILYVVGSEQTLHFQQLFKIADLIGLKTKAVHVPFGLFFLPEGKMSTRKGNIILLEEVIDETIKLAEKTIQEKNPELKNKKQIAKEVGIGAIIFWDLIHDRTRDVIFDIKRVLDFEGETGPYVQYTHARATSILRKAPKKGKANYELLVHPAEQKTTTLLSEYPSKIEEAASHYKPSIIAKYLVELSQSFNEFYHACNCIKEQNSELRNARLGIVSATAQVLKNGLELLGLKAPKEM